MSVLLSLKNRSFVDKYDESITLSLYEKIDIQLFSDKL